MIFLLSISIISIEILVNVHIQEVESLKDLHWFSVKSLLIFVGLLIPNAYSNLLDIFIFLFEYIKSKRNLQE